MSKSSSIFRKKILYQKVLQVSFIPKLGARVYLTKQQICRLQKDTSYFVGISDRKIYVKAVGVIGQRRFLIH
nr:MAG TPA: hypothetical protein [Caudoviricetes sp.]